jgi:hypothetical protein
MSNLNDKKEAENPEPQPEKKRGRKRKNLISKKEIKILGEYE